MKLTQFILVITFLFLLVVACNHDKQPLSTNIYDVSFSEAQIIASSFTHMQIASELSLRNSNLTTSKTFYGANNLASLHVFNYESSNNKSFVIVSGDNRITPVLAYGLSEFPLDSIQFGVADWMSNQILMIDSIRQTNTLQSPFVKELWEGRILPDDENCCEDCPNYPECLFKPVLGCGGDINHYCNDDKDPCGTTITVTKGPLLSTRWGQDCPYNIFTPADGCTDDCLTPRTPTGCVATAMAQIIRFHEFPANYLYVSMPDILFPWSPTTPGSIDVAQLMADAGIAVSMDYGCEGSGAKTCDIPEALENNFGFTSGGTCGIYSSSQAVKTNIDDLKPIILAACADGISIFDWTYSDCHAWICDGYKTHTNTCYGYLYYSMNWGWNGRANGWYAYNSWAPINSGLDFAYGKRQVLNINN